MVTIIVAARGHTIIRAWMKSEITNRNRSWTQIKQFHKHLKLSISIIIITYSGWTWSEDVDTGYGRTEWNERDNLHIVACPRDKDEMRKFFFGHVFFCVFVRRCNNIQCPSDLLTFTTTSSDPASTFSYHILFLIAWSGTRPRIDLHWDLEEDVGWAFIKTQIRG